MAQNPPPSVDVTDIQFKVHDRFAVFNVADKLRSSVNLLAVASNYGLMFVGNPNEAELKVILIKDLVESKNSGKGLHARQVQLPNLPNCIAVSSDGSMLAVNYTQNGCGFVIIYSVPSFTTANIKSLHNIRLPGDENISALQLLWNPVISGSLAVVMSNGALGMYDFKNNSYEFHTLDSKEQINCGSWSPKGKQIVLGFPNGKLAQYKPDLKPARTIVCPPNIHPGPFDTISIQWLSTFQFAVVFLQKGDESTPSLYIVHAPKVGTPTYTNYYDICYSGTGPRQQQVHLTHIQQWNLLLVTSANGVEIGILGTRETTEAPTWIQYTLLDEARIEMPLTEDKDETYPIGFALDTSSTHSLIIAEKNMPVMPMVHVLSTHGQLVAFNFLNLQPNTPDICSPPPPLSDTSGISQFKPVIDMLTQRKSEITIPAVSLSLPAPNQSAPTELSFAPLGATSTPALEKPKPIFGAPSTGSSMFGAPSTGFSYNPQAAAPIATSAPSFFRNPAPQHTSQPSIGIVEVKKQQEPQPVSTLAATNNQDKSKPLFTVQPTFTPPTAVVHAPTGQSQQPQQQINLPQMNANEIDDIVNEMIVLQINSFDMELKKLASQSKGLLNNIGSPDEMKTYTKRLNDLQEIVEQANDKEFESDLQGLRNLLNETYTMVAECRSKLNMYNNPDIAKLKSTTSCNPINRRQLAKLQSYLANNQAQLQIVNNQIDAQWSNFQDVVRRNSKTQMHTPCLEGIYQRMTKLKDMIARERTKLNFIKSKLKEKGLLNNQLRNTTKPEVTMESLTDTILSMSLGPAVEESRSKLTKEKLDAIRERLENRKITIIKPQRPDRVGLNSEVILETKLKSDRKIRDGAATNMDKMEQERIKTEQQRVLTKPMATKAVASSMSTISQPIMASISQPNAPATFGFGGTSPFVKPNSGKPDEFKKDQQHQQPAIVKPVASTAAPMFFKATRSTTATPSAFGGFGTPSSTSSAGFPGLTITPSSVPAFSGFGTNKPLTFGAPKPLIPNVPAKEVPNNENTLKEQTPPIGFAPKPMVSEAKPFAMPNFSSPFTAVTPSKPAASDVGDKENKTPDTQSFMPVATKSEIAAVSSSAPTLSFGPAITPSQGQPAGFSFATGNGATLAKPTSASPSGAFTFSFSSALNGGTDTTTTAPKTIFGSIPKPAATTAPANPNSEAPSDVTEAQSTVKSELAENSSDAFTFSSLNLGTLGLPATPNLSPTPSASAVQPSNTISVAPVKTTSAPAADPTDSLFGGLNICKPLGSENGAFKSTFAGGNIFGSTSFASTDTTPDTKSIFGAAAPSKEPAAFTGFGTATDTTKSVPDVTSVATTATPTAAAVATTSTTSVFAPKDTQSFSFGLGTSTTVTGSIATGQAAQTTTAPSMFAALSATSSFGTTSTPTTAVATSAATGGPVFSGLTFGTPTTQPTSSIFGTAATSVPTPTSSVVSPSAPQFLNANTASMPVATPFGGAVATSAGPMFSSVAATTTPAVSTASGNIFGGIPKPDPSVFNQPEGNIFGAAGNVFGGQSPAFGAQPSANTSGSIFGGAASATNAFASNTGSNIFASPTTNAAPNVFAAAAQSTGASGGSMFDQSTASGQSGGSLFGGAATGFGTPSSPFGGAAAAAASGGSIFGGSATSPKASSFGAPASSVFGSANNSGFGMFSQTPAFGSLTQAGANAGGGSFAQGGSSIAQTGFGSPTGTTAFTKPVFGAAPSFGGAPTFGSPPSFGAAATFGGPKAFGSFAAPNATGGAFTSPTQKNNLFEALGSSDTGLSFGNLAQNTNANQQKPAFGGSSFMSYRS